MGVETFAADPAELVSAAAGLTALTDELSGFSVSEAGTAGATGSEFAAAIADNAVTIDRLGRAIGAGIAAISTSLENSAREFVEVDSANAARIEDSGYIR